MLIKHNTQRGYTIVELMVTVSIFALAFVAIAAIFLGYTTSQSRANQAQRLLNEGNYFFESVVREVRMNAIDYTCNGLTNNDYGTLANNDYICLRTASGQSVRMRYDADTDQLSICRGPADPTCANGATLTPSFLKVTNFGFYVFPETDPTKIHADDIFHPQTVLTMSLEAGQGKAQQTYDLQTAVSSRVYEF